MSQFLIDAPILSSAGVLMRIPLRLPDLGVHDEAVRVSGWLVDRGEFVIAGDRVAEVLLPGVTFEVEAAQSGTLIEIVKPVDAVVARGETLCWLDSTDDESNSVEAASEG